MKKMAKLFAVLAAMALALSFSACSSGSDSSDDDDETQEYAKYVYKFEIPGMGSTDGGTFEFRPDGTCTMEIKDNSPMDGTYTGNAARDGTIKITLNGIPDGGQEVTINGGSFSYNFGTPMKFERTNSSGGSGNNGSNGSSDSDADSSGEENVPEKKVTIPNGTKNIKESAFYNNKEITQVEIPSTVKSIGANAFEGCTNLKIVSIGWDYGYDEVKGEYTISVEEIGSRAFCGCKNLTDITIPRSVTYIGTDAFSDCDSLVYLDNLGGTWSGSTTYGDVVGVPLDIDLLKSCQGLRRD